MFTFRTNLISGKKSLMEKALLSNFNSQFIFPSKNLTIECSELKTLIRSGIEFVYARIFLT